MTTADRCKGMTWQQVRDAGLLGALIAETGFGYKRLGKLMGWPRSQYFREACQAEVGKGAQALKPEFPVVLESLPKEAEVTGIASDLGNTVYRYLHNHTAERTTVAELSERLDRSERSIREALQEVRAAGFCVDVQETDEVGEVARLSRTEPASAGRVVPLPWYTRQVQIGIVTDTHLANLFAAEEELHFAYDRFAAEGITDVFHAGDLVDGSGRYGYPGHSMEVREDCYTPRQTCAYAIDNYPQRDGITTRFIESMKCHAGWDLQRDGFDHGYSLQYGFNYLKKTPQGSELLHKPGRPDLQFLGYDSARVTIGPESLTLVDILHPGGGSSYALSYRPQKWSESLEGGSKPHLAIMGHYHKLNYIRPRNIHVLSAECLEWQTPFMARHGIQAHVGFAILRLGLDSDGTIREFKPEWFPFFLHDRTVFDLGRGEAA